MVVVQTIDGKLSLSVGNRVTKSNVEIPYREYSVKGYNNNNFYLRVIELKNLIVFKNIPILDVKVFSSFEFTEGQPHSRCSGERMPEGEIPSPSGQAAAVAIRNLRISHK